MAKATEGTIEEWQEPSKMPTLAFILERCRLPEMPNIQPILDRPDKPPEWDGDLVAAAQQHGIFAREIQSWLEAGKETQREHIRKREADPKWREMAQRLGAFPGLKPRVQPTEVPTDPEKRSEWAHKKAIENGWMKP